MKKMTAAMAALGVVAGLGAAALPLASYASEATVPVTATTLFRLRLPMRLLLMLLVLTVFSLRV